MATQHQCPTHGAWLSTCGPCWDAHLKVCAQCRVQDDQESEDNPKTLRVTETAASILTFAQVISLAKEAGLDGTQWVTIEWDAERHEWIISQQEIE